MQTLFSHDVCERCSKPYRTDENVDQFEAMAMPYAMCHLCDTCLEEEEFATYHLHGWDRFWDVLLRWFVSAWTHDTRTTRGSDPTVITMYDLALYPHTTGLIGRMLKRLHLWNSGIEIEMEEFQEVIRLRIQWYRNRGNVYATREITRFVSGVGPGQRRHWVNWLFDRVHNHYMFNTYCKHIHDQYEDDHIRF